MPRPPYLVLVVVLLTSTSIPSQGVHLKDLSDFLQFWDSPTEGSSPQEAPREAPRHRVRRGAGDSSQLPYMVETSALPYFKNGSINYRYMPVLGNGIISTSVYSNVIHVNGLFNGEGGGSHRADVPAVVMTKVTTPEETHSEIMRKYQFNIQEGVFLEIIDTPYTVVHHRTYVHQKYVRLLVTDVKIERKDIYGETFYLNYPDLNNTGDILFEQPQRYNSYWKVSGRTKTAEKGASPSSVHSFYHTRQLSVTTDTDRRTRHIIMVQAVDIMESDAKYDFDSAINIIHGEGGGIEKLFELHKEAWEKTWAKGKIEIDGELHLQKTTLFSQYYLLASMPPMFAAKPPSFNTVFTSIARNSLGRGSKNKDYRGHIFWDNEMYILPAVVLFNPDLAKAILRIRSSTATIAREYAQTNGHQGYQFPWERALTGRDVTPDNCRDCRDNALHVTGAVGWSIRQYYSATRDREYMTLPEYSGCDMTREIARFWATLAVYNNSIGRYDINNVTGPDDWHPRVNNNAYTNVMASLAIHWARYFACLCDRNERDEVPDEWMAVADFLELPFDNEKRVHHQFQGYESLPSTNQSIKQADTILLTYPINWNTSRDIMLNDLEMYESKIQGKTPAMTFSFMSVGFKWGYDISKMDSYFLKSYEDYVVDPFKIWTEYPERSESDQEESTVNFLPGMSGYLQSLIYGYAGIRIRPEFLEFHNPTPPPRCNSMLFTSFDYLGNDLTIDIRQDRIMITLNDRKGDYTLILKRNKTTTVDEPLTIGGKVTIDNPKEGFYILANEGTACEHPRDYIYMPWGYSPWIGSASFLHPGLTSTVITTTVSLLLYILQS